MTYKEKLLDPRWQKRRLEILKRDDFRCILCYDPYSTLHIHHERYSGEPWDAIDDDLKTYCKHCHSVVEQVKKIFPLYEILGAWKGSHSIESELILFVSIGFRAKRETSRMVLIYKFENDVPILVLHLYPPQVFRIHELSIAHTFYTEDQQNG